MTIRLSSRQQALGIVLGYAFLGSLWILFSDSLVAWITDDPTLASRLQTLKGWGYVLVTGLLLYSLIRRSQHSLLQSANLLQSVVDGSPDAVFVKDRQGRYVLINEATANIFGRPSKAILGHQDLDLLPPDYAHSIIATDREVMTRNTALTCEHLLPNHGEPKTYWCNKYPWHDRQGRVQGIICIARDISDRNRLMQERQQLIETLQQRTYDLEALNLVTANAVSTLHLDELLSVLLNRIVSVTAADAALILLTQDHTLTVKASIGIEAAQLKSYNAVVGEGIAGTLYTTGKPLYVEDLQADLRFRYLATEQPQNRSILAVPLKQKGQILGVLKLIWHQIHPYQAREMHWLEITAERCTMAILNAQLFEQTKRLQERLQLQINRMPIGCVLHDQNFLIIDWNPAATAIFGYSKAEVLGRHPRDLIIPASAQLQLDQIFQRLLQGDKTAHSLNENVTKDGRLILCEWSNTPLQDQQGNFTGLLSMVQDVTEQQRAQDELQRLAFYDSLTGLPQGKLLQQRLGQLLGESRSSPFALLYLDIERFQVIKYSLGRRIAESLLIEVAHRLESCLAPPTLLTRIEGGEFAILLETVADANEASRIADTLQQALTRPFNIRGLRIFTTSRLGIALHGETLTTPESLLAAADTAMNRAKAAGTACEIFDRTMQVQAAQQLKFDADLRIALEQSQFQLYYQPIFSLATHHLVGFEALVRWHHPERGIISPNQFIPIAEQTGLIVPLGEWVLQQACQQLQQWQQHCDEPASLTISINLSVIQLRQTEILSTIDRLLQKTCVNPRQLKLEITETAIMENAPWVTNVLRGLRTRHISLMVDDFGTGYSSLSYLHTFPFDALKIDQSFVGRLGTDQHSIEIIRTILLLARNLNKMVVAEGIETPHQLKHLQQLGCEQGQGYLFARPMDALTTETFLQSHQWQ